jgi:hypothetical protein
MKERPQPASFMNRIGVCNSLLGDSDGCHSLVTSGEAPQAKLEKQLPPLNPR